MKYQDYVIEKKKLDRIFDKMQTLFSGGETFFSYNLVFYKNGLQRYGNNYFTSLEDFVFFVRLNCLARQRVVI